MSAAAVEMLRAHLRQRRELGETELVLARHTAAELHALLRPPLPARPAPPPSSAPAAPRGRVSLPVPEVRRPVVPPPARAGAGAVQVGGGPSAEEIARVATLDALREVALGCPRCGLCATRRSVVFGEGPATAEVMVVGEAPGADEDRSGRPFVGAAGRLLDRLLLAAGFEREAVYVCNVLKCRPPGNRDPSPAEVEACTPYLLRQVELVRPRVIVAFGAFAAQTLLACDTPIGRLRGGRHAYHGVPLVPTYHPAACLRHAAWIRGVWDDLQRARAILDPA